MSLSIIYIEKKIRETTEVKWFSSIMLICCMGYAVFKASYRELGDIFQTILFIGTLCALYVDRKNIIKDKIFVLLLISLTIPILSWINSLLYAQELATAKPKIAAIANFYFFFFIAYWLKGSIKHCHLFLISFIFGVLLTFIFHSPDFIYDLKSGLIENRIDFNYVNANHGAALLGCVILVAFFYIINIKSKEIIKSKISIVMCILILIFAITLLVFTQSRQAWLATIMAISFMSIVKLKVDNNIKVKVVITSLFIVTLMLAIISNIPIVSERLSAEHYIIPAILSWDINNVPYSSMGIRIHLWYESFSWIKNNPIFGLGGNTRAFVISTSSTLPDYIKVSFSHLHNGFLGILVNYGINGLLNFMLLFYFLIKSTISKKVPIYLSAYAIAFILYFCIINLFESFLLFKSGMYLFNCMSAVIYTFHLKQILEK
ncbi:TPA: O-antigen ligase family protein [Vibrio cholerae]